MAFKKFVFGVFKYTLLIFSLMLVGALSTFVTLRLFTAGDEVAVPDLTAKDAAEAIHLLREKDLQLKILPQKRFSDRVGADKIVAQRPEAGQKIKKGRSVEVYLSLGPEKVIVPELTSLTSRVALLTLQQQGLQEGKLIYVSSPGAEPDQVVAQFPVAGTTMIGANRTVSLLVNGGLGGETIYVMPDVIGKNVSEVGEYLRLAGLRVGLEQPVPYPGISPATIVKQTPPAGYKVTKSTFIGLYYSK